jgi:hypothetical protein
MARLGPLARCHQQHALYGTLYGPFNRRIHPTSSPPHHNHPTHPHPHRGGYMDWPESMADGAEAGGGGGAAARKMPVQQVGRGGGGAGGRMGCGGVGCASSRCR